MCCCHNNIPYHRGDCDTVKLRGMHTNIGSIYTSVEDLEVHDWKFESMGRRSKLPRRLLPTELFPTTSGSHNPFRWLYPLGGDLSSSRMRPQEEDPQPNRKYLSVHLVPLHEPPIAVSETMSSQVHGVPLDFPFTPLCSRHTVSALSASAFIYFSYVLLGLATCRRGRKLFRGLE